MVNLIFRTKLASENENYFRKLAYEVNNSGSDNNTNSRPRPHDTSQPPRKKSNTNNNEDDKPSQPFNAFFNFFKDGNSNEPESSRNPMSDILSNFFQSTATMAENGAKDKAPQSSSGRSSGATGSNNSNQQSSSSEFRTATGATNSTPQSSSSGQPNFSYSSNYQTTNTYTNASTFQTTSDNNTTPSNANEHANREPPKAKNPTPTVQYIIENNISVSTLSIRDLKRILLDNNVASSSSIEKHDLVVQLERLISAIKIENKESKSFPDELLCKVNFFKLIFRFVVIKLLIALYLNVVI
jgi:hypothetical protein